MSTDELLRASDSEKTDASPGMVALIAFGLAAIVALGLIIGWWLYHDHNRGGESGVASVPREIFQHGVDQQTGTAEAWREQDRLVHEHLETYGWVDRAAGVVHIPITRAMELMLVREKATETAPAKKKPAP